jgi:hypothetical protein
MKVPSEFFPIAFESFNLATGAISMPAEVLLVDDRDGDVRLIRQALRVAKLALGLNVAIEHAGNEWLGARGYGLQESC